ncbi:MAG TPA: signal peptidase I [Dissulfurispiraceae bacterium]
MDRTDVGRTKLVVIREYAESILIALIIALVIRALVVQPFKIPSSSMEDTLLVGDHLLISKFIFGFKLPFADSRVLKIRDPKRGDVIVFAYPKDTSKDFIKRVIGVPGDTIEIKDKRVYVNGRPYDNPHEVHKEEDIIPGGQGPRDNFGPVKVPANAYFVMGDNRDLSYDSRFWGFVGAKDIKGLAFIKYWSWDQERSRVRWGRIGKPIE